MKNVYLAIAIIGAVIPAYFFIQHFAAVGYGLFDFLAGVFANPAASGFTSDLLISSFAFWIFMFTADAKSPRPWVYVVLNLAIGLSCAFPAYLYARECAKEKWGHS